MRLLEFQAKELLAQYLIPVPQGMILSSQEEAAGHFAHFNKRVALKAQVPTGGRGKAGGIALVETAQELEREARRILALKIKGLPVKTLLVEEALEIAQEFYLSLVLDLKAGKVVLMASPSGGMEIEEVAEKTPEKLIKIYLHPHLGLLDFQIRQMIYFLALPPKAEKELFALTKNLFKLYSEKDAVLAEINPLVLTKAGSWIAGDAKLEIDDCALFRRQDLKKYWLIEAESGLEKKAREENLAYVKLAGNIGIIGNGAGLVMNTLDMVQSFGGKPANFLDLGGGAGATKVKKALELLLSDSEVKGIFINIFGGITRCDEVAKGLKAAMGEKPLDLPVVIRLVGTRQEEGMCILKDSPFIPVADMQQAAKEIVALVKE